MTYVGLILVFHQRTRCLEQAQVLVVPLAFRKALEHRQVLVKDCYNRSTVDGWQVAAAPGFGGFFGTSSHQARKCWEQQSNGEIIVLSRVLIILILLTHLLSQRTLKG